jgi:putative tricarboxylic transport membrane protein
VIALLVVFALVFETLGFLLSTILLLVALLRAIEPVPWRRAIPIAILVPFVCWYVLDKLLLIQLPSGVLSIG